MVYGKTDEYGMKVAENEVHVHDFHATILHLLGFDHTKLTFRYMLLKRAYTRNDFEEMIGQTGFDKFEIRESLTGLDVWLNKFPAPVLSAP